MQLLQNSEWVILIMTQRTINVENLFKYELGFFTNYKNNKVRKTKLNEN